MKIAKKFRITFNGLKTTKNRKEETASKSHGITEARNETK